jgi:hypothetical protein
VARPDQSERTARRGLHRSVETLVDLDLLRPLTRLGVPVLEVLDESGSGDVYVHPYQLDQRYFTLPHRYWEFGLDQDLDLAAKATLLLARSLSPDGFTLPLANATSWYGISATTLRRGMRDLVKAGLAIYQSNAVEAPNAPRGFTIRRTYLLTGAMRQDPIATAPGSSIST